MLKRWATRAKRQLATRAARQPTTTVFGEWPLVAQGGRRVPGSSAGAPTIQSPQTARFR
jgi:hypothetical protein